METRDARARERVYWTLCFHWHVQLSMHDSFSEAVRRRFFGNRMMMFDFETQVTFHFQPTQNRKHERADCTYAAAAACTRINHVVASSAGRCSATHCLLFLQVQTSSHHFIILFIVFRFSFFRSFLSERERLSVGVSLSRCIFVSAFLLWIIYILRIAMGWTRPMQRLRETDEIVPTTGAHWLRSSLLLRSIERWIFPFCTRKWITSGDKMRRYHSEFVSCWALSVVHSSFPFFWWRRFVMAPSASTGETQTHTHTQSVTTEMCEKGKTNQTHSNETDEKCDAICMALVGITV